MFSRSDWWTVTRGLQWFLPRRLLSLIQKTWDGGSFSPRPDQHPFPFMVHRLGQTRAVRNTWRDKCTDGSSSNQVDGDGLKQDSPFRDHYFWQKNGMIKCVLFISDVLFPCSIIKQQILTNRKRKDNVEEILEQREDKWMSSDFINV